MLVGVTKSAVRQHLSVLKAAGLVLEETEHRTRPGRPHLLYRINPEARGAWRTGGHYKLLALLFSEVPRVGDAPAAGAWPS